MLNSIKLFHGTSTDFSGKPTAQICINGLLGIYMTTSREDAKDFAYANTEGAADGIARVFAASVPKAAKIEDISELAWEEGWEHEDIIEAADQSQADIVILPDMSGTGENEFLVKTAGAVVWA